MKKIISITLIIIFLVGVIFVFPMPPKRIDRTEKSPDGKYLATFSWQGAGIIGVMTKDNPWIYLSVENLETKEIIIRESTWGDVTFDDRLSIHLPWKKE